MKRSILLSIFFVLISIFSLQSTVGAATITVTQLTDRFDITAVSGCSLREAIQSVNLGAAFNTGCAAEFTNLPFSTDPNIPDQINLIADTYVLSVDGNGEDNNASGDLDVRRPVDIIGAGSLQTTITASGLAPGQKDRVFDFACLSPSCGPSVFDDPATLSGMTIRDGDVRDLIQSGGGIISGLFLLTLDDVIVTENFATDGGGIFSAENVLVLLNSQILNNEAIPGGGFGEGGGIWSGDSFLVIDSSTVAGNMGSASGGGIFNAGPAVITNSTISGNQIVRPPAPTSIQGATGLGGGIADLLNQLVIINSTISGNTAFSGGGGIAFLGVGGGSIGGAGLTAPPGLYNVTIARNTVSEPTFGLGGGICNDCFNNTTTGEVDGAGGNFLIADTLIAENQAAVGPDCQGFYDGLFDSVGFNLIGDIDSPNICVGFIDGVMGDKVGGDTNPVIDPMITDLQDNGGPTFTHGLLQGSLAIDMGDPNGCMAPSIPSDVQDLLLNGPGPLAELLRDQRNFPRPIDGDLDGTPRCDIGAFEFQTFAFDLTKVDDSGGAPVPEGDNFEYLITVTNNGPGTASNVTINDPLPANVSFVSASPSQGSCAAIGNVVSCDLGDLAVGESATVTVTVTAVEAGTFTNIATLSLTNPSQQTVTLTAQVTTTISGGFIEGSGIHCGLSPVAPNQGALEGLFLLALISVACLMSWRRRAR